MSDGEFLGIQPTELKFPFELKKQSSCSMQLTNKTDQYVAFKVKTTNPKKYCVRPNTRIVLPMSTCDVTERGKVVDEFKLRVTYVPAGPPSPVPEEPEEGSSTLENGLHSLQTQDSVSRSSEPSKEKSSEALAMISKLTEEKHTAIQQNQKASAGTGSAEEKTQRGGVDGALIGYIITKL